MVREWMLLRLSWVSLDLRHSFSKPQFISNRTRASCGTPELQLKPFVPAARITSSPVASQAICSNETKVRIIVGLLSFLVSVDPGESPTKKRPSGGSGGAGGNVYAIADSTLETLQSKIHHFNANPGGPGGGMQWKGLLLGIRHPE